MHIQVTHNEDVRADASLSARIEEEVRSLLGRFEGQLTAVVLNLNDLNSHREGGGDKRVSLEVRPNGHRPIAVHQEADTFEDASRGAAKKMQHRLDGVLGKRSDVKGGATIRKTGPL
jgi:hypothetical protein